MGLAIQPFFQYLTKCIFFGAYLNIAEDLDLWHSSSKNWGGGHYFGLDIFRFDVAIKNLMLVLK